MVLVPCSSCRRHVRSTERACPFCGGELFEGSKPAASPHGRYSRAALVAFAGSVAVAGAGLTVASIAGCGSDSPTPADTGGIAPAYGVPADTSTGDTGGSDGAKDSSTSDGGEGGDGGSGDGDAGSPGNLYGAPPG